MISSLNMSKPLFILTSLRSMRISIRSIRSLICWRSSWRDVAVAALEVGADDVLGVEVLVEGLVCCAVGLDVLLCVGNFLLCNARATGRDA